MKGVVIPTITPMTENGAVDEQGVAAFAEYLIEAGVDCLYPNGTNGESLLLTEQERQRIAEIMVETSHGRVPVFIQCGAMKTQEQIVDLDRKLAGIPGIPGLKALLKIRGVIQNDVCRKPLRALSGEEYKKLEKIVEEY